MLNIITVLQKNKWVCAYIYEKHCLNEQTVCECNWVTELIMHDVRIINMILSIKIITLIIMIIIIITNDKAQILFDCQCIVYTPTHATF